MRISGGKNRSKGNSFVRILEENGSVVKIVVDNLFPVNCHSILAGQSGLELRGSTRKTFYIVGKQKCQKIIVQFLLSVEMDKLDLLLNVHSNLEPPKPDGSTFLMRGNYHYYHYGCDGFQDVGWGCGYRTLQSICSWIILNKELENDVPNIPTIQQTLVEIKDKPERFFGSREWIGTLEAIYVIDTLFDVSCKVIHISKKDSIAKHSDTLKDYFETYGGLIMMGGDMDAASKGIAGIHVSDDQDIYLLVIDPHLVGKIATKEELYTKTYVKWQKIDEFVDSSFYNLCLPMMKIKDAL